MSLQSLLGVRMWWPTYGPRRPWTRWLILQAAVGTRGLLTQLIILNKYSTVAWWGWGTQPGCAVGARLRACDLLYHLLHRICTCLLLHTDNRDSDHPYLPSRVRNIPPDTSFASLSLSRLIEPPFLRHHLSTNASCAVSLCQ